MLRTNLDSYTTYEIDKILNKYDPDGNLDLDVIFSELSDEDKEAVIELVQSNYNTSERVLDSAEQLYTDAINHNLDASPDYIRGIIDFYEALVDEGYIDEFGK